MEASRRTLARVGLVTGSVVVALAVGEATLRVVGYEGAQERLRVEHDAELGDVMRGSWIHRESLQPGERFVMNNVEHAVNKPPGVWRILFLGDSGTAGSGVGAEHAFPAELGRRAERPEGRSLEVINSGVPGLTTIPELALLEGRLLVLEPDVVVLGLFMANDLQFNLERVRSYTPPPEVSWLRSHSALAHILYLRLLAHSRGTALSPALVEEHGIGMNEYIPAEFASYIAPTTPTFRLAYEILADALRRFRELSETLGFSFVVVLIPSHASIVDRLEWKWPELTRRWRRFELRPGESIDVQQPTREVLAVCDQVGVTCLDPRPALAQELGDRAILEDDDHPTAEAHALIARELSALFDRDPARYWGARP